MSGEDAGPTMTSPLQTSLRLLRRARAGDRDALDELFARFVPRLRRWAHGRLASWARTVTDTADVVQDAMMQTFQRINTFEPQGQKALEAYLRQAVRNRIIDQHRKLAPRRLDSPLEADHVDHGPSPLDAAILEETTTQYRGALARLRDDEQELVVGRLELGYSHDQLAVMTGRRTPDAARVAVKRALIRLAEEMAPR